MAGTLTADYRPYDVVKGDLCETKVVCVCVTMVDVWTHGCAAGEVDTLGRYVRPVYECAHCTQCAHT